MALLTVLDDIPDVCSSCFKVTLSRRASRSRNQGKGNRAILPLPKVSKTFSVVRYSQGRNEARWRPRQKAFLALHVRTWAFSEADLLYWREDLWNCCDFPASPQWFGARGIVPPLFPLVMSLGTASSYNPFAPLENISLLRFDNLQIAYCSDYRNIQLIFVFLL